MKDTSTPIPLDPRRSAVPEGLSLLGLVNVVLRQWVLVVAVTLVVTAAFVTAAFFSRSFKVTSSFMPRGSNDAASSLAGLAAQFGVSVNRTGGGESLTFYAELPTSRDVLRQLAHMPVTLPEQGRRGSLMEYLGITGGDVRSREARAIVRLASMVSASSDQKAGLVLIETVAPDRSIAEAMNRRLLDLVNEFNLQRRQSAAGNERRFAEARMREAQGELAQAEASMERFLATNRAPGGSPQLMFEQTRLQRRVQLQQEVYLSLAQAYEQARIDEVRDTPVLTIIESPEGAAVPAGTGRAVAAVIGLVVGGLLGLLLAFAVEAVRRQRSRDPVEYAEFMALRDRLLGRLGRQRSAGGLR